VGYVLLGIRHELGNPINSIKAALTVVKKNIDRYPTTTTINYIDRMLTEVGRVEYLLKSLKSFTMHEHPKLESLQMVPFMEQFIALIRANFDGQGISIEKSFAQNTGTAIVDPRALHQVLLNLVSNAADAVANCPYPQILFWLQKTVLGVQIKVIDNGVGLTEYQQSNLFKPFHTSKPQGTGLGLVIVKKMMIKMDGSIEVKSLPEIGTEVTLTLRAGEEYDQPSEKIAHR
jgi:C4-dicarboxylate-specific signal transduction histidine kinase